MINKKLALSAAGIAATSLLLAAPVFADEGYAKIGGHADAGLHLGLFRGIFSLGADRNDDGDKPAPSERHLSGTVSAVGSGSFTLATRGGNATSTVTVNTDTSTDVSLNGKDAALADIKAGDKVLVSGSYDPAAKVLTAAKVSVLVPVAHVIGKVEAVNGDIISVLKHGITYTIDAAGATILKGFGFFHKNASVADIAVGSHIMALGNVGTATSSTNFAASLISLFR